MRHGKSRGQEFSEYWLNEEQALLISVLSNAPTAAPISELDLYATVKRIMGGDVTASEDELLMMAAYLIGMLEDDH